MTNDDALSLCPAAAICIIEWKIMWDFSLVLFLHIEMLSWCRTLPSMDTNIRSVEMSVCTFQVLQTEFRSFNNSRNAALLWRRPILSVSQSSPSLLSQSVASNRIDGCLLHAYLWQEVSASEFAAPQGKRKQCKITRKCSTPGPASVTAHFNLINTCLYWSVCTLPCSTSRFVYSISNAVFHMDVGKRKQDLPFQMLHLY